MIDAGTIGATLRLDISPFASSVGASMALMTSLGVQAIGQSEKMKGLENALNSAGAGALSGLAAPFSQAAGSVNGDCLEIVAQVSASGRKLVTSAANTASGMLAPLRNAASSANGIMQNFGQGMINGLAAKQPAILAKARSIANSVSSGVKKALGIASPSKVMIEVGKYTAEGLAVGMNDGRGRVEKAAENLADSTVSPFGKTAESARSTSNTDLSAKLDTLIELLRDRQEIELDGRTFGRLVRQFG